MASQYPDNVLKGVDFYHGNSVISFHDLAAAGLSFVFLKSSQGTTDTDPAYRDRCSRAGESGLIYGAYHFFASDDPVEQARHFIGTAAPLSGDLIPALDVETEFQGVGDAALACANEIKTLCGKFPLLYASDDFFQEHLKPVWPADSPLWIARYGNPPATPCAFVQFTDQGRLPGVDGYSDLDLFNGDTDDLQQYLMP